MYICIFIFIKCPRYRPTCPRGVQQVKAPQISRHSAHEGGKFVTPTHRPPLPPGISFSIGTWTCRMLRERSPVARPGIDPGTFPLVAQRLNHYATPGPTVYGTGSKPTCRQLPQRLAIFITIICKLSPPCASLLSYLIFRTPVYTTVKWPQHSTSGTQLHKSVSTPSAFSIPLFLRPL